MIRIIKPSPPGILLTRGLAETQALCDAHERGERKFSFDDAIYAAPEVRSILRNAQHDKCAFCESKFAHIGFGDVEHFRPKAAVVQKDGDALEKPGYYWLVYEWSNLFLSCQLCNQRFKRNLFPLRNPRKRARSHNDKLGDEKPLLLDPATTNPIKHIGFRDEVAYPINGSKAGAITIEVFGLNRPELVEARRTQRAFIGALQIAIRTFRKLQHTQILSLEEQTELAELETLIQSLAEENACYTAMARTCLRELG